MQDRIQIALERIDAHARAMAALASDAVEVGSFTAFLPRDPSDDAPAYAIPRATPADNRAVLADVAELRRLFEARGRPLRVELSLLGWSEITAALASAGLDAEEETPLYVCLPDRFAAAPAAAGRDAARVRWVGPGDDLAFVGSVMRQGNELRGGPPSPEELAALAAALAAPVKLALAELGAVPAGTGCSTPLDGVTEISSVSTLPTQRRRGVAAALVSFMVGEHFAAGGDVAWACSAGPAAAGLLYGLGFEDGGLRVCFAAV